MNFKKAKIKPLLIAAIAILIAIELILRLAFGLGHPALSQADRYTGYRFQPNQKLIRFGRRIEYNQYSQRSKPITQKKPQGVLRILMTGDSILNGGNPTDQKETITELFEAKLVAAGHPAEILNASAGSWGIGNQLGYLQEFGIFNADAVILEIGAHDLTQPTSTSDPVGRSPYFPTHPPLLAIEDAWTRYLSPKLALRLGINISSDAPPPTSTEPEQQFKQNMESFTAIVNLIRAKSAQVFVLFVPNRYDLLPTRQIAPYKSEFFQLLKTLKIPAIDLQTAWSKVPLATVETYYRDFLHINVLGNYAIANLLFQQLCLEEQLRACEPQKK